MRTLIVITSSNSIIILTNRLTRNYTFNIAKIKSIVNSTSNKARQRARTKDLALLI